MSHIPAAKHLGQHFLTNPRTIARIVEAIAPQAGQTVAEIGPGTGALTEHLLAAGSHVLAIEMDERCYPVLESLSARFDNRLTLVRGDALKLESWLPLLPPGSPITGNLPYNVGTEIVTRLLLAPYTPTVIPAKPHHSNTFPFQHPMTFMLQKEVIQRLTANGPGEHWGRLGVLTHLLADAKRLFDVPPGCFTPPPKVMSSIVRLTPLSQPRYPVNLSKLDILLRHAFGQRRKMLRASLKGLLDEAAIAATDISPTARPEELGTAQLVRLSERF